MYDLYFHFPTKGSSQYVDKPKNFVINPLFTGSKLPFSKWLKSLKGQNVIQCIRYPKENELPQWCRRYDWETCLEILRKHAKKASILSLTAPQFISETTPHPTLENAQEAMGRFIYLNELVCRMPLKKIHSTENWKYIETEKIPEIVQVVMQGYYYNNDIKNFSILDPNLQIEPLRNVTGMEIGAFSATVTDESAYEVDTLITTLRANHSEPLYLTVDKKTHTRAVKVIEKYNLKDIHLNLVGKDRIAYLHSETKSITIHGKQWSPIWILEKLLSYRNALEQYKKDYKNNKGVCFVDADIIFNSNINGVWYADIVVSDHAGPGPISKIPKFHGIFNAGLLLTNHLDIIDRWIELYKLGESTFYEQQCIETLTIEYVCDHFPRTYNWGGWRWSELLGVSNRKPPLLHIHLKHNNKYADKALIDTGKEVFKNAQITLGCPDKIAFYHNSKSYGTSFMRICHEELESKRFYKIIDSHGWGLGRDWNEGELDVISKIQFYQQKHATRWLVHNHGQNWPDKTVKNFLDRDWKFIALNRPILDRLCSFYFWNLRFDGNSPMKGEIRNMDNINDFLIRLTEDPVFIEEWKVPTYYDQMDVLNLDQIVPYFKNTWNLKVKMPKLNTTNNTGWDKCVEVGIIKKETEERILNNKEVQKWINL